MYYFQQYNAMYVVSSNTCSDYCKWYVYLLFLLDILFEEQLLWLCLLFTSYYYTVCEINDGQIDNVYRKSCQSTGI